MCKKEHSVETEEQQFYRSVCYAALNHLSSSHVAADDAGDVDDGGDDASPTVGVPVDAASPTPTVAGFRLVSHRLSRSSGDHHAEHAPPHDLAHRVVPAPAALYRRLLTEIHDCLMPYVLNDFPSCRGHWQLKPLAVYGKQSITKIYTANYHHY